MTEKKAERPDTTPLRGENRRALSPAAQRALAEAEARRAVGARADKENIHKPAKEIQGPAGPEPTRYGDWENKGIASDF